MEVNNSYQPLQTEVTEPEEFCRPTSVLEKREPTGQHSKSKTERKGKYQPALKVAGRGLNSLTNPTAAEIKERPEVVGDPCDSKTSTLIERRPWAAVETQAERSPVGVTGDAVTQVLKRPYTTSYFLSGKLEGKPVQFLIDTGCTTNLLSKHVFDRLPEWIKSSLEESDSHGVMADGTQFPFCGVLRLPLHVRDVKAEEVFVVSRISEDAI